jgi:hypothetical protein
MSFSRGGDKRVATIEPALGFEVEMGKSTFTLKQEGFKDVSGTIGQHSFSNQHQIFTLGAPEEDEQYDWALRAEVHDLQTLNIQTINPRPA